MEQSVSLFNKAQHCIPGGVNSPVRAFKGVGGSPIFIKSAEGPYITDEDSKTYIDYVGSWGPMILGHNNPEIREAVIKAVNKGLSYGAPTAIETELAKEIIKLVPSIEMVRMVNSGTEATMSAIRLARAFTNRTKIIKFEGCYHGHSDSLLVKAGSGALTLGEPTSPGVPEDFAKHTLTATYNDLASVEKLLEANADEVAAIIVEPVAGNMNCILPVDGFLEGLRRLCNTHGALLIFDEVMTGFRVALGCAQERFEVTPDITTLGKVIGGGMPVGAFGGRKDIMEMVAPVGPMYQAGTLSGNPVAMAAGLATLKALQQPGIYDKLHFAATQLTKGLKEAAQEQGIAFQTSHIGGMFGLFFTTTRQINTFGEVTLCNIEQFKAFYHGMLEEGVYLAPSAYEAGFVSTLHSSEVIEKTIEAANKVFAKMAE